MLRYKLTVLLHKLADFISPKIDVTKVSKRQKFPLGTQHKDSRGQVYMYVMRG